MSLLSSSTSEAARGYYTVGIGGQYSSLAAAEAVATTQTAYSAVTLICLDTNGTNSLGNVSVAIDVRQPSNGYEFVIQAQTGQSHGGWTNRGALCGSVFVVRPYVQIKDMRIRQDSAASGVDVSDISNVLLDRCVILGRSGGGYALLNTQTTIFSTNITVRNCLLQDASANAVEAKASGMGPGTVTLSLINCDILNAAVVGVYSYSGYFGFPFYQYATAKVFVTNCIVTATYNDLQAYHGSPGGTDGGIWADWTITADQTADDFGGVHCQTGKTTTALFLGYPSDTRIKPTSPAWGAALTLSGTQYDGANRPRQVGAKEDVGWRAKYLVNSCVNSCP